MKKLPFSILAFSLVMLASCGGSSIKDTLSSAAELSSADEIKVNLDEITSAYVSMTEYKSLMEKYSAAVKSQNAEEAKLIKEQLDILKQFADSKWQGESLKAMGELSRLAIQIESGKDVDLDQALDAYSKSLDAISNMPGSEDAKEAIKASEDILKAAEDLDKVGSPE